MSCSKCSFYYEDSNGIKSCHFEEPFAPLCDDCDDDELAGQPPYSPH